MPGAVYSGLPEAVPRACYTDPAIFADECARVFERAWLFVAHESELAGPGDFLTTELAGQPALALRGDDGDVRVFYNTCRHRGALVELDKSGNRDRFQCLYHHWEYGRDGALRFVPREDGYGADFCRQDHGLSALPQVASYGGLIFACMDANTPPLETYLGAAKPFLDDVSSYDGAPLAVYGNYEYSFAGNWKLFCENTMDDYHAEYLHHRALGQRAREFRFDTDSTQRGARVTHAVEATRKVHDLAPHTVLEWTENPAIMTHQTKRVQHMHVGIFPSLYVLYHPVWDIGGIRVARPDGVGRTRVELKCLGPASASAAARREAAERFHYSWGPGGRVSADDIVAMEATQKGLRARTGGDAIMRRGLAHGRQSGVAADEHALRGFWRGWKRFMTDEAAA